jgi:biotin carboxyl carrier protein
MAPRTVGLAAPAAGKIGRVAVNAGDSVQKGQPLVEFE